MNGRSQLGKFWIDGADTDVTVVPAIIPKPNRVITMKRRNAGENVNVAFFDDATDLCIDGCTVGNEVSNVSEDTLDEDSCTVSLFSCPEIEHNGIPRISGSCIHWMD